MKDEFIKAIRDKKKVRLTFKPDKTGKHKIKLYAPIDLKSEEKSEDTVDGYDYTFLLWDEDPDGEEKEISLNEQDIHQMEFLKDEFDPAEFEFWDRQWSVERDWDEYH